MSTRVADRHRAPSRLARATTLAGTVLGASMLALVTAGAVALLVVPKLTGSVPLTVLTGSMAPTYPPGSVVVVRPTPVADLGIGDAVTYQVRPGHPDVVTHRITAVSTGTDGEVTFTTQGDNNDAPDPEPVLAEQVHGRVWYSVPLVGHAASALAHSPHRDTAVTLAAWSLLGYGGYLLVAGAVGRGRQSTSRPRIRR